MAAERHARTLRHLEQRERASVEELARLLRTSFATVRRDLTQLAAAGLLRRVHGGAVLSAPLPKVPSATPEDEALALAVYRRLASGDAVVLEGRRVMPAVARRLASEPMRLIVVTNELDVAQALLGKPNVEVILLGGKLHPAGYTLPQPLGASDLKFLVANKAFIEAEGIHVAAGVTTTGADDARFKHDLLQHALHKTVVAAASCAGLIFGHRIAQIAEIDRWITTPLDGAQADIARTLSCEVIEARE